MSLVCQICFSCGNHPTYRVRDQQFGWGDEFDYFCCADCGCLQISHVPENLARFYPPNYYSFHAHSAPQHGLKAWLRGKRDFSAATGGGVMGRLLNKVKPASANILSMGAIPARKEMRILDVGCGSGGLLSLLHRAGMGRLEGADPYISGDLEFLPGLWVYKRTLDQVSGEFDLIMLHHAFEHVESGLELLLAGRQRLSGSGKILLRFPTPESAAWERYRKNWVQLDAPRHLFLHTRKSLGILAARAGLRIERCWCDSSAFQFWGSELYQRGLSIYDENGLVRDIKKHFSNAQMRTFAQRANILNSSDRGDQLAVVLHA